MKTIYALILSLVMLFSISAPALAGDIDNGAKIFSANCASCHMGGRNVVNSAKTLQKSDLEKYDMYSLEKIVYQVANGKAAMPRFLGRLNEQQIEDVASYVLSQADKGW
ncbi:MAG: c-type cytochrome [Cyanobacterium sp. T60_A2020_053]|nr:c-type cytochrome [Cyanobacterium sp. T60_A2020_053]